MAKFIYKYPRYEEKILILNQFYRDNGMTKGRSITNNPLNDLEVIDRTFFIIYYHYVKYPIKKVNHFSKLTLEIVNRWRYKDNNAISYKNKCWKLYLDVILFEYREIARLKRKTDGRT